MSKIIIKMNQFFNSIILYLRKRSTYIVNKCTFNQNFEQEIWLALLLYSRGLTENILEQNIQANENKFKIRTEKNLLKSTFFILLLNS